MLRKIEKPGKCHWLQICATKWMVMTFTKMRKYRVELTGEGPESLVAGKWGSKSFQVVVVEAKE